jgi:hypothetical protein
MTSLDLLKHALESANPIVEDQIILKFDEIVAVVENEDFDQAVALIEEEFKELRFDIRLLVYFLFAHFLDRGIGSFKEILLLLHSFLFNYWEYLSPVENRDYQIHSSFIWFFSRATKQLEYVNRQIKRGNSASIKKFTQIITSQELKEIQLASEQLGEYCSQRWSQNAINKKLILLTKMVQDLTQMAREGNHIKIEESPPETQEESPIIQSESNIPNYLLSSDKMDLFNKKLEAFELLVKKMEYRKAGLVADDIAQCIENFNPIHYFPKLFVNHFLLLSENMQALHEEIEDRDSIFRKTLEKLYHADLDIFIEWKEG